MGKVNSDWLKVGNLEGLSGEFGSASRAQKLGCHSHMLAVHTFGQKSYESNGLM